MQAQHAWSAHTTEYWAPTGPSRRELCLLSLDPPVRWGLWGWRVRQKGLLKWQSVDVNCQQTRYLRRHFL